MATNIRLKRAIADYDPVNNMTFVGVLYHNIKDYGYGLIEFIDENNNLFGDDDKCLEPTSSLLYWTDFNKIGGSVGSKLKIRAKSCKGADNCPDWGPECKSELIVTSRLDDITVLTRNAAKPPAPTSLTLTPGYKSIKIEFIPGGGTNIIGYLIYIQGPKNKSGYLPVSETSTTIYNLDPGTYNVSVWTKGVRNYDISDEITASTTIAPVDYTHTMKFYFAPWPWYSPGSAIDWFATNLSNIIGKIADYFSSVTDYQYVGSYVTLESGSVVLNVDLKQISQSVIIRSMVPPVVIGILGIIFIAVGTIGLIWQYLFIEKETGKGKDEARQATPEDQKGPVLETSTRSFETCSEILKSPITCDDVKDYGICIDAVVIGIMGTLIAQWPNFTGFKTLYSKYEYHFRQISQECTIGNENTILNKINTEHDAFNKELGDKYDELSKLFKEKQLENCLIPGLFGGCLLSKTTARNAVILLGVGLGGYFILTRVLAKRSEKKLIGERK